MRRARTLERHPRRARLHQGGLALLLCVFSLVLPFHLLHPLFGHDSPPAHECGVEPGSSSGPYWCGHSSSAQHDDECALCVSAGAPSARTVRATTSARLPRARRAPPAHAPLPRLPAPRGPAAARAPPRSV